MPNASPLILAKHEQVRSELIKRIRSNEFLADGRLPSERQLMAEYRVSGATISRALMDLEQAGQIQRIWGKGTFVRQGSSEKVMQIGVALTSFLHAAHPWRLALLRGIEIQAQEMDCRVHCLLMQNDRLLIGGVTGNPLPLLLEKGMIQGLVFATPVAHEDAAELSRLGVAMVATGSICPGSAVASVVEDSESAAKQVTEHLLTLGHRRIAFFPGPIGESNPKMVRASSVYAQALLARLAEAGLPLNSSDIYPASYEWSAIEPTIRQMALSPDRPQTLVFRDDLQAKQAMDLLESHGLSVPDDMAIISFGDILQDSVLTSVSVPAEAMGRRAVEMLVQSSTGELELAGYVEHVPVNLTVRRSSLVSSSVASV